MKVVQQGGPCTVLGEREGAQPGVPREGGSGTDPWGPAAIERAETRAHSGHSSLQALTQLSAGKRGFEEECRRPPRACRGAGQGRVGDVTSSFANLSDLQQAFSALMSLVSRNSRNSGLWWGESHGGKHPLS